MTTRRRTNRNFGEDDPISEISTHSNIAESSQQPRSLELAGSTPVDYDSHDDEPIGAFGGLTVEDAENPVRRNAGDFNKQNRLLGRSESDAALDESDTEKRYSRLQPPKVDSNKPHPSETLQFASIGAFGGLSTHSAADSVLGGANSSSRQDKSSGKQRSNETAHSPSGAPVRPSEPSAPSPLSPERSDFRPLTGFGGLSIEDAEEPVRRTAGNKQDRILGKAGPGDEDDEKRYEHLQPPKVDAGQPHPSEKLQFATVSYGGLEKQDVHDIQTHVSEKSQSTSTGQDEKHASEYLEFTTAHGAVHASDVKDYGRDRDDVSPTRGVTSNHLTNSNDDLFHGLSSAIPDLRRLSADARNATEAEHNMTITSGFKLYPKAILWSVLLSSTIIMEGYDTTLVNSFLAFPIFRQTYGTATQPGNHNHQIAPSWQTALQTGALVGEIFGLFVNGYLVDRIGYHKTMIIALVWMILFVFLAFFSFNIEMLLASQILCGIPWGVFQTLSMSYAAEIMPIALRAYLLANVNMCWLIGQVLASGILRAVVRVQSEWSYRIPFGLQWAFAVPILIGVIFAPDSPWWLVRHGKIEEAKRSLLRLTTKSASSEYNVDDSIAMLRHTDAVEKHLNSGTGYKDCFKGTNGRRTEIACMVWIAQTLCGLSLTGWAAYYYEQAGFSPENAFNLAVGMYGLAIIGGVISWLLLPRIGRRRLYLVGLSVMQATMLVGGICAVTLKDKSSRSWAVGSLLIVLTFVYDITVGPVCYVLVAELPSTRLRVKTVVLARVAYNLVSLLTNFLTSQMLSPTAWNWAGKANFLYAGTNLVVLIWAYFRLPETFGLSYLELDILFEKKAGAKKFHAFQVNLAQTGYFSLTRSDRQGSVWRGY